MPDFEVVVVDDGSTDGGGVLAAQTGDPRIRLITQENRGVSAARNRGIRDGRGDLIAFLDADDEWHPGFLEAIVELRRRYPDAGILATGFRRCFGLALDKEYMVAPDDGGGHTRLIRDYLRLAALANLVTSSSAVVPRAVFEKTGAFPEGEAFGEDRDLWIRIALEYPVAFDTRVLAVYHSEAEGRACQTKPARTPDPPAVRTLRAALTRNTLSPHQRTEIQSLIDTLHMQYAYWCVALRDREGLARMLAEPFFTNRRRWEARLLAFGARTCPLRLIEAIKYKPRNLMGWLKQPTFRGRPIGTGETRVARDVLVRLVPALAPER